VEIEAGQAVIQRVLSALLQDDPPVSKTATVAVFDTPAAHPTQRRPKPKPKGKAAALASEPRACTFCSNTFSGRPGQKFCSARCADRHRRLPQRPPAGNGLEAPHASKEKDRIAIIGKTRGAHAAEATTHTRAGTTALPLTRMVHALLVTLPVMEGRVMCDAAVALVGGWLRLAGALKVFTARRGWGVVTARALLALAQV